MVDIGNKTIALKEIIDEALEKCINRKVLVVKRTNTPITMKRAEIFGCNPY
jgi:acetyl-CoA synthetase